MKSPRHSPPPIHDCSPAPSDFQAEVLAGLSQPQKSLPCKYFYDERGSQLFDQICELDEYYLTRTELAIMQRHAAAMADRLGSDCLLIEYGSGSSRKTRLLLDHLRQPAGYVPTDISRTHLARAAAALAADYPDVPVLPTCADFTRPFPLPECHRRVMRRVVYFPGSTIGNFSPPQATDLLRHMARQVGRGGGVLIGVDLKKDRQTLERAYNDQLGVTAAFNLNLLVRINRELGGDFCLERFQHQALFNEAESRIEMYLVSLEPQRVQVGDAVFHFAAGETIHTENSYKFTQEQFAAIAADAGLRRSDLWTDDRKFFSVQYLERME